MKKTIEWGVRFEQRPKLSTALPVFSYSRRLRALKNRHVITFLFSSYNNHEKRAEFDTEVLCSSAPLLLCSRARLSK